MEIPFIYGVQYYRAPTPDRPHWKPDLEKIRSLGFTHVKLWVQWRWSHRKKDSFYAGTTTAFIVFALGEMLDVWLTPILDLPQHRVQVYPIIEEKQKGFGLAFRL